MTQQKPIIKRIWEDYKSYIIYQGQQDYYKYPIYKRVIPTIVFIFENLIFLIIALPMWIYLKIFLR